MRRAEDAPGHTQNIMCFTFQDVEDRVFMITGLVLITVVVVRDFVGIE